MGVVEDKINELKTREAKVLQMGGEKALAKHHEKGKLSARERLNLLFDEGSFREIDMLVSHRCVNFDMEKVDIPSDGVITGHGLVAVHLRHHRQRPPGEIGPTKIAPLLEQHHRVLEPEDFLTLRSQAADGDRALLHLPLADRNQHRDLLQAVLANLVIDLLIAEIGLHAQPVRP